MQIGFAGVLAIVFIVLKLTGYIAWSWWWVLSPLWIGAVISLFFLLIAGLFFKSTSAKFEREWKKW